jgi:hypothetical protein
MACPRAAAEHRFARCAGVIVHQTGIRLCLVAWAWADSAGSSPKFPGFPGPADRHAVLSIWSRNDTKQGCPRQGVLAGVKRPTPSFRMGDLATWGDVVPRLRTQVHVSDLPRRVGANCNRSARNAAAIRQWPDVLVLWRVAPVAVSPADVRHLCGTHRSGGRPPSARQAPASGRRACAPREGRRIAAGVGESAGASGEADCPFPRSVGGPASG